MAWPYLQTETLPYILDTDYRNGVAPGRLGFSNWALPTGVFSVGTTGAVNASQALQVAGTTSISYLAQECYNATVTYNTYLTFSSGQGTWLQFSTAAGNTLKVKVTSSGNLAVQINTGSAIQLSHTLVAGTTYIIDGVCDVSTSTFSVSVQLSDTTGSVLAAATSATLAGQTPDMIVEAWLGDVSGGNAISYAVTNTRIVAGSSAFPIGVHTSNDTDAGTGFSSFPTSFLDQPSLISSGMLVGAGGQSYWNFPAVPKFQLDETSAKYDRAVWLQHLTYQNDIYAPPSLDAAHRLLDGRAVGHYCLPVFDVWGFNEFTVNWPAAVPVDSATYGTSSSCLAAWFTDGHGTVVTSGATMDSQLAGWCSLWNTLPATPFLIRLWREMAGGAVIYGSNGAAHGGVNETPATYQAAFKYVAAYIRAHCTYARIAWCIASSATVDGTWYPTAANPDWLTVDGYVKSPSYTPISTVFGGSGQFYPQFNTTNGTVVSGKPTLVTETMVQTSDPSRTSDIEAFTSAFEGMPAFSGVMFWDGAPTGSDWISDSPAGFLSAFQSVVSSAPFLGTLGLPAGAATAVSAAPTLSASVAPPTAAATANGVTPAPTLAVPLPVAAAAAAAYATAQSVGIFPAEGDAYGLPSPLGVVGVTQATILPPVSAAASSAPVPVVEVGVAATLATATAAAATPTPKLTIPAPVVHATAKIPLPRTFERAITTAANGVPQTRVSGTAQLAVRGTKLV